MLKRNFSTQDILTDEDIEKIHQSSINILENTGIEILNKKAVEIFTDNGAKIKNNRVYLSANIIEEAIQKAPSNFILHARNPEKSVIIGEEDNSILAPGAGAPFVTDLDNGRRKSTYDDYVNLTKLASANDQIDIIGTPIVEPNDIPDKIRHAKMFFAAAKYSDKCLMGSALGRKKAHDCFEMVRVLFGKNKVINDKSVVVSIINSNSPLQYDNRMLGSLIEHAKYNQAVVITPAAMAGFTAPMSIAGTLTLQNVEVLTGITLSQLINPGSPVVYGGASTITDMKTANLAIGSSEYAKFVGASAQLARYYNLPSRSGGSLTDSVMVDAQAGYESMLMFITSINQGLDFILHAAGILDSYMTLSYEKFVIDNEIIGMIKDYHNGIEVNEDTIAEEIIDKVGPGGNYLEEPHTLEHMRDFREPQVSNRVSYNSNENINSITKRANKKWKQTISDFNPPYLDPIIEDKLKKFMNNL